MNYEQYHQKGGTYVLPVEVFDNLLDEKEELEEYNKKLNGAIEIYEILLKANVEENQKLKEDISFCLKSIEQEMKMSTDSRTRQEMLSCYQILKEWSDE